MGTANGRHFSACRQALQPIFTDGLQHQQAWDLSLPRRLQDETLIDKGSTLLQHIQRLLALISANKRSRLKSTPTDKDGKPPEEALLLGRQQVVAPLESIAQGLLATGQIPCTSLQNRKTTGEASEQGLRRQELDACCRQFDSQRQAVQADADLGDRSGIGLGQLKRRQDSLSTFDEEMHSGHLHQGLPLRELREIRDRQRRPSDAPL